MQSKIFISMLIGASEGLSNSKASKEIQSKYYLNTSASLIHRSISEMVELYLIMEEEQKRFMA